MAIGDQTWARFVLALQRALPAAGFGPANAVLAPMRAVKDAAEIEALRRAGRHEGPGFQCRYLIVRQPHHARLFGGRFSRLVYASSQQGDAHRRHCGEHVGSKTHRLAARIKLSHRSPAFDGAGSAWVRYADWCRVGAKVPPAPRGRCIACPYHLGKTVVTNG